MRKDVIYVKISTWVWAKSVGFTRKP